MTRTIPQTTLETLTDAQIEQLMTDAGRAGDRSMVSICETALGRCNLPSQIAIVWARKQCVTVIASWEAEARS